MRKIIVGGLIAAVLSVGIAPVAASAADLPVTGIVTLDGTPVAATEVGWFDPYTGISGETLTAADGSYALTVADGHPYVLYAGLDHNAKGRWLPLGGETYLGSFFGSNGTDYLYQSLTAFTTPTAQNIALSHPGAIVGKAAGLAKQRITLESLAGQVIKRVRASATGRYEFAGLLPGRYRIRAFEPLQAYEVYKSTTIVVTAGTTTRHTPKLTRTGTVTGIVTVGGKPTKGVLVSVSDVGIENGTTTNASGRYTVTGVPTGHPELWFSGQGTPTTGDYTYGRYSKQSKVRVTSGKTSTFNVAAPKPTLLTATVVPTMGAKNLEVRLVDRNGKTAVDHYEKVSKSHATVGISLPGIAAGRYTMVITDSTNKRYAKKRITLKYGTTTALGGVSLAKKTVSVSGSVTSDTALEISFENAYGMAFDSVITDGRYRITGLVPGAGTLRVNAGGHYKPAPYFTEAKNYELRLTRSTVLDVTDGGPQLGLITGTVSANGYRVFSSFSIDGGQQRIPLSSSADYRYNIAHVTNGVVSGEAEINGPRTYKLTDQYSGFKKDFISGSPYWFDLPGGSVSITSARGTTTDAGTLALVVQR